MNRLQVIEYIKESMMSFPYSDYHQINSIAKLAERDDETFKLVNEWMGEVDPVIKYYIFEDMLDRLNVLNGETLI